MVADKAQVSIVLLYTLMDFMLLHVKCTRVSNTSFTEGGWQMDQLRKERETERESNVINAVGFPAACHIGSVRVTVEWFLLNGPLATMTGSLRPRPPIMPTTTYATSRHCRRKTALITRRFSDLIKHRFRIESPGGAKVTCHLLIATVGQ